MQGTTMPTRPPKDTDLARFLPESLKQLDDPQKDIPRIAKDAALTAEIEQVIVQIPTTHHLYCLDVCLSRGKSGGRHTVVLFARLNPGAVPGHGLR